MVENQVYATLYVFDEDGNIAAEMPCFNEDQVKLWGAKYPKVLVAKDNGQRCWLSFKPEWAEEFKKSLPVYAPEHVPLEWLRGPVEGHGPDGVEIHSPATMSKEFYDGWGRH